MKGSCPYCESVQTIKRVPTMETIEYKGTLITCLQRYLLCTNCNQYFDTADFTDWNLYRVKYNYEVNYGSEKL